MRIALNRQHLLGFRGSPGHNVPVTAAKVGNKPTIGISVASATSGQTTEAPVANDRVRLTFPAATDR
jgi:hypothetical protein